VTLHSPAAGLARWGSRRRLELDAERAPRGFWVATLSALALSLLLVLSHPTFLWITLPACFAVTVLQVQTLRRVLGAFPLIAIVIGVLNTVGVAGYVLYPRIADVARVSARLGQSVSAYRVAAGLFLLASAALWIGGLLGSLGGRSKGDAAVEQAALREALVKLPAGAVLLAALVPVTLTIIGTSPQGLLHRSSYLDAYGPLLISKLSGVLLPAGVALLGLVLFNGRSTSGKRRATLLLLLYMTVLFAKGTRLIGLVPLILLGCYLSLPDGAGKARRLGVTTAALVGAATVFLLQLPLALRSNFGGNGLGPYVSRIIADPGSAVVPNLLAVFGNVLFAVPLTGSIATATPEQPLDYFLTSIDPRPGGLTAWPTIAPLLRVNINTPFNALGELSRYGLVVFVGYLLITGFVVTRLQRFAARTPGLSAQIGVGLLGGLLLLFSVSLLQYNLRSGTRQLWYALVLLVVLRFVGTTISSTRRNRLVQHSADEARTRPGQRTSGTMPGWRSVGGAGSRTLG